MTDHSEYLEGLEIEDGVVRSFGKFENEPISTVVLWGRALDGSWGSKTIYDGCDQFESFEVDAALAAEFPNLTEGSFVVLWETDNGFVHHAIHFRRKTSPGFRRTLSRTKRMKKTPLKRA